MFLRSRKQGFPPTPYMTDNFPELGILHRTLNSLVFGQFQTRWDDARIILTRVYKHRHSRLHLLVLYLNAHDSMNSWNLTRNITLEGSWSGATHLGILHVIAYVVLLAIIWIQGDLPGIE
jgi:hypothetical protein